MKRFILALILSFVVVNAFAQYNDSFREEIEAYHQDEFLIDQFTKGQRQIASGGIILTSTMVFDAIYYGVLAYTADVSTFDTAAIIGGAITCVGVIASLCQFAIGYSNVQKSKSMIRINENGALCITFAEKRKRPKPTPSWRRENYFQ